MEKGEILNFDFTGGEQSTILPPGEYQIECWGAGSSTWAMGGHIGSSRGAYAKGNLIIEEDTPLYIFVGGQGGLETNTDEGENGGYNGGGHGGTIVYSSYKYRGFGGHGATDVRLVANDLTTRIIVAGGAGSKHDGHGGAPDGSPGTNVSYTSKYWCNGGGGATQLTGGIAGTTSGTNDYGYNGYVGSFGQGGLGGSGKYHSTHVYAGGGGGGGYYGGGGSAGGGFMTGGSKSGGGGSSYVGGVTSGIMISGADSMPSPNGETETGHAGTGYCRITCINAPNKIEGKIKVNNSLKDIDSMYVKVDNTWREIEQIIQKRNNSWNIK